MVDFLILGCRTIMKEESMNKSKLMTLIIALVVLCGLFTACGTQDQGKVETGNQQQGDASGEVVANDWSTQKAYTVKALLPGTAKTEDCEEISALATDILKEKFNTTLDLVRIGWGTYNQEVNLMLSSGEKLDMLWNNRDIFVSAVNNGQIVEIGQYFDEYAPEMKAQISPSDWQCTTVNGGIYAVPANKEKAVAWGFTMVKEIADATGVDYSEIDTEEELLPLLMAVKEQFPDVYPIASNGGTMNTMTTYDDLGYDFGVLENCTNPDDLTVVNWYATDAYKKIVERRYDWSQKGLIMPDAAANTEPWGTMVSANKAFGRFTNVKPGIEAEQQKTTGKEMVVLQMTDSYTTTTRLDILWYVAHNSEMPERAVQVMNEIYTNSELQNILVNGVEGKHFEFINEEKTLVAYPEGVSGENTGYPSYPWAWLNEMITPVWEGSEPTLWDETDAFNKSAIVSPAMGFAWTNDEVLNEVTACNNVRDKYVNALDCGVVDPAVALPEFLKELEEAGVNEIVAEKQRQLDEWVASK